MSRPVKYTEEMRKSIKHDENIYYYNLRRQRKIEEQLKTNLHVKNDFIKGLCSLAVCNFSHFITLTFDPKKVGKQCLLKKLHDEEIKQLVSIFPDLEKYLIGNDVKRQTIDFVQKVTTAFINYLTTKKMITNILTAIEKDKKGNWHVHALISTENLNIDSILQSSWFYGHVHIEKVGYGCVTDEKLLIIHRKKIIKYMYKTFNPTSRQNNEQKRLDYWYLHDFIETKRKSEPVAKVNNALKIVQEVLKGKVTLMHFTRKCAHDNNFISSVAHELLDVLKVSPVALFYLLALLFINI